MTGLYVSNRTVGVYGSIRAILIVLTVLYVLWGLGWYWVTPPGLRELPLLIPYIAMVAIVKVVLYPVEVVTGFDIAGQVLLGTGQFLDSIGLLKVIMNFGNFQFH